MERTEQEREQKSKSKEKAEQKCDQMIRNKNIQIKVLKSLIKKAGVCKIPRDDKSQNWMRCTEGKKSGIPGFGIVYIL